MLKDLVNAIGFLTVIPLNVEEIRPNAPSYFPIVGLLLGGILSGAYIIFIQIFPVSITVAFILIIYIILTGGLHLDGLADTVDSLSGGGKNKEKILEIMSDSHIGTQGVIALICALGLKFALLMSISADTVLMPSFKTITSYVLRDNLVKTFLLMPVFGRWAMTMCMFYSKPAKEEGLGKLFIECTKTKDVLLATLFVIISSYLLFQLKGIIVIPAVFATIIVFTKFLTSKIGGMTGDTIGAVNEITEIAFLICIYLL